MPSHVRGRKIVHRLNETVEVDVAYTIKHGQPALYSCAAFMRKFWSSAVRMYYMCSRVYVHRQWECKQVSGTALTTTIYHQYLALAGYHRPLARFVSLGKCPSPRKASCYLGLSLQTHASLSLLSSLFARPDRKNGYIHDSLAVGARPCRDRLAQFFVYLVVSTTVPVFSGRRSDLPRCLVVWKCGRRFDSQADSFWTLRADGGHHNHQVKHLFKIVPQAVKILVKESDTYRVRESRPDVLGRKGSDREPILI